jgi:hypothetical protein
MSSPAELVESCMANAASSFAAADYAGAEGYAGQALAYLPAANATRGLAGGGSQALSWNSAGILAFIGICHKKVASVKHASVGPFQQINQTYQRADDEDEYV